MGIRLSTCLHALCTRLRDFLLDSCGASLHNATADWT
jgi:hypothetical protein